MLFFFLLLIINTSALSLGVAGEAYLKYKSALQGPNGLLVNMVSASILSVCSDSISQIIEQKKESQSSNLEKVSEHSIYRSFTMAIYGTK